jgi:hypothetical protein
MKDFLRSLEDDDDLRERYRQNPQEVAKEAGLDDGQVAALTSGSPKEIRLALENESPGDSIVSVVMVE